MPSERNHTLAEPRRLVVASLFSGIGGIELGLQSSGHETVFQCELLPPASHVLSTRFSGVKQANDITTLRSLPSVDMITAGFPCQDLSQAGRSVGIRGENSSLIDCLFKLVEKKKPRPEWILLENVPFMLQLNRGEAIRHITSEITRLGYRWAYRIIDARSFGLPQRRRRVIFLASRHHDPKNVLFADETAGEPEFSPFADAHGFYWTEGNRGIGWTIDGVPTIKGSSGFSIPSPPAIWHRSQNHICTPDIRDAERLQGFPINWTMPASQVLERRKEAIRWKLIGNAVSVPVAKWVGRRLASMGNYSSHEDKECSPNGTWPVAAWGEAGKVFSANLTEWPKRYSYRSLAEFLRFPTKPLSLRATSGFYARLKASQLRRPFDFDECLAQHIEKMSKQLTTC
ncbi:DNA cytosine methyltransferase [Bremerella sp.]|uniref:DNA cytosine methyltransferase n=1 Tax=Bremerella sp. TaxID=2795602 RepID=UPI00391D2AA0